ncbi:AbrB/MazE/SpoVT family DNA-binding domain-containing protein [Candidatus Woesearchaeota archaeon]|nr:AbrB/MazE/SpoVT family DNA-binding domain-containing protein [Candidatus Woesearchaeota archaeon]
MKRKVNRVGQNTLTVSLPSDWVKQNSLKKGDELELDASGVNLIISVGGKQSKQETRVDLTGQDEMVRRIVAAVYKGGYDEAIVRYSGPKQLELIQACIDRHLADFDIVEYLPDAVRLRAIWRLDSEQFMTIFKRVIYSIKTSATDSLTALQKNDTELMKIIVIRDKSIDKYTDFCRRTISKNLQTGFNRPHCVYYILEALEIIGDLYKDLCSEVSNKELVLGKYFLNFLKEVNVFFGFFSDLFFDFSMDRIAELGRERVRINKLADSLVKDLKKHEIVPYYIVRNIFNSTFEMKSALLTENL